MYTFRVRQEIEPENSTNALPVTLPHGPHVVSTEVFRVMVNESDNRTQAPSAEPILFAADGTPVMFSVVGSIVDYDFHHELNDIEDLDPVYGPDQFNNYLIGGHIHEHLWILRSFLTDPFWIGLWTLYVQMYTIVLLIGVFALVIMMVELYYDLFT